MYYEPENVPAEHRQPYKRSGLLPGRSTLSAKGINTSYANAMHEGGPRNGVLTAIEDFMNDSTRRLELFMVRGPQGLGLLLDRDRLKKTRGVGPVVNRVHNPAFGLELSPQHASRFFD
jgi:hypothetical protein